MTVRLRRASSRYPDLTAGQEYAVIGIEADDYRIINDHGLPYLYPAALFHVTDSDEPADWIGEVGHDGERYAYPPALNCEGFFEDFFDGDAEAVSAFWRTVNHRLAADTVSPGSR